MCLPHAICLPHAENWTTVLEMHVTAGEQISLYVSVPNTTQLGYTLGMLQAVCVSPASPGPAFSFCQTQPVPTHLGGGVYELALKPSTCW